MAQSAGFRFKQFYVSHAGCAMKVGTDSILLGSWTVTGRAKRILDIGTGSGLLALMMAQKTSRDTQVHGIDIDLDAIEQARINVLESPWHDRIQLHHTGLQTFQPDDSFDLIVSNPPYFPPQKNAHLVQDANFITPRRRQARHTTELELSDLFSHVARLLNPDGFFACVLPTDSHLYSQLRYPECLNSSPCLPFAAAAGLFPIEMLTLYSQPQRPPIRQLFRFSKQQSSADCASLLIKDESNSYSAAYKNMCKDFYLNF